ncbi:FAD-binding protein, partial [Actinoplanes sp. NPDC026623]|uniref:FAD-binding oxidoreductase n=1 Tax=Actinoplanes sp. NPDC026623 TaxID=3155610 RepID=UPI0033DDD1B8
MNDLHYVARWGDPADAVTLPPGVTALLGTALGVSAPTPGAHAAVLPRTTLDAPVLDALRAACGRLDTDDAARLAYAAGKSTEDLLRLRAGDATGAPDAVARPGGHDEVEALLAACARHRVAVVPFGGGTSVVGGLAADRE